MDRQQTNRRIWFLAWGFGAAFTVLGVRLTFVQSLAPIRPDAQDDTGHRMIRPAQPQRLPVLLRRIAGHLVEPRREEARRHRAGRFVPGGPVHLIAGKHH